MEPSTANEPAASEPTITIGRYVLHREIARGGMATIHFGRLLGDEGFSRIVAVKRLHAELAQDEQFVAMFLSEARIASRVQHRNVVPVLDVATVDQEVILVQEYVHGVPLDLLLADMRRAEQRLPIALAVGIACQLLAGLQATHDTTDELGQPMHIVHRDVSPQNVMLAVDGSARLLDFGIATAGSQSQLGGERTYKGKLAYSAPEQLQRAATPQSDIYSASVLLWELLVGERMHGSKKGTELVPVVLSGTLPRMRETLAAQGRWHAMSEAEREQLEALEPVVQRGLAADTSERWTSAHDMEQALIACVAPAPGGILAEWARTTSGGFLALRARILATEEQRWRRLHPLDNAAGMHGQGPARSARNSIPPDVVETTTPAAKKTRRARLPLIAGCSVALAAALALLLPTTPMTPPAAKRRDETQPRSEASPAASLVAPRELAAPAPVAEPPALAPLALPPRPLAVQPRAFRALQGSQKDEAVPLDPAAAKRSDDCEVPYYYEGTKKLFKSACL